MKSFKYKTKFEGVAHFSKEGADPMVSLASVYEDSDLKGLRAFLPSKAEADANPDFLHFSCNLAAINLVNRNGDGCQSEMAVALAKNCKFKQVNIEHDRTAIVGVITGAGFTTFGTNLPMTEEEALATKDPFNLAISGVIWRVSGDVADILERCDDPEDDHYHMASASWEIGFNEYHYAIGSRTLALASISDETEKYEKFLRSNGGSGMTDRGVEVFRVIKSGLLLGMGVVTQPASQVQGIVTHKDEVILASTQDNVELSLSLDEDQISILRTPEFAQAVTEKVQEMLAAKNIEEDEKNISILNPLPVIETRTMKFNSKEELYAALEAEASIDHKEMKSFLDNTFTKADELYNTERASKEEAVAKTNEAITEVEKSKAAIADLESKLSALEAQAAAKELQDVFDARMNNLEEGYDLNDSKVRSIVAKQIKELDEEGFKFWMENDGEVILASHKKGQEVNPADAKESLKEAQAAIDIPNAQSQSDKTESIFDLAKQISF